jgi:[ribosomal protein S18]-alanine N-acetyltransferase
VQQGFYGDVEIRPMTEDDLDEIISIERHSFAAPWSRNTFRETLSVPYSHAFTARKKVDNRVVGYANFYLVEDEVQVLNIAVDPESRKKGYATSLLAHAIGLLKERGAEDFFLEVREGNKDAMRLYEKLGFIKIGRRRKYYPETKEDAIVMHLKVKHETD